MQISDGIIERVWALSGDLQRLEVAVAAPLQQLQAGQSLLALNEAPSLDYLREAWIPVETQAGQIIVERPRSSIYHPGQAVSLLGPVGGEFPLLRGPGRRILLLAQDTSPLPLLFLAQSILRQSGEVALILAGRARAYPYAGIPSPVEVLMAHEDGSWPDERKVIEWADQIFAVADEAFWMEHYGHLLQKVKAIRTHIPPGFLYGVFSHLPLPCGVGACAACLIRFKNTARLACTQGPAFDLTEVWLG
jgi:hypothetical protein